MRVSNTVAWVTITGVKKTATLCKGARTTGPTRASRAKIQGLPLTPPPLLHLYLVMLWPAAAAISGLLCLVEEFERWLLLGWRL
ncbi:hypothetical protein Nepgr_013224 [Nepenthes gracilis]|uniref:Uncharacterized protein n=1 Tax=Nepenthes gracilis TaxID=150966 RepID=A0AAD3XNT1_NEPGR|nr:hypothetical protein Nepgr_013224 [Nepenthes gracilis]